MLHTSPPRLTLAIGLSSAALGVGCSTSRGTPGKAEATAEDSVEDTADLEDTGTAPGPTDDDGDGVSVEDGDCDDHDPDQYPGAAADPKSPLDDPACEGQTSADLSGAAYTFSGPEDAAVGTTTAVGDVDGDGLPDVILANWTHHEQRGAVAVFLGRTLTASTETSWAFEAADHRIYGDDPGDAVGLHLGKPADVDGDGLDDLFIGAPGQTEGGEDAGRSAIVLGRSLVEGGANQRLSDADIRVDGPAPEAQASVINSVGDIDGDGFADVAVGAWAHHDGQGSVGVFLGRTLARHPGGPLDFMAADYRLLGATGHELAGREVGSAGDIDGDGLDDILVLAPWRLDLSTMAVGRADVVLASSLLGRTELAISLSEADHTFIPDEAVVSWDTLPQPAGDIDGDGLGDLIFGTPRYEEELTYLGRAELFYGATLKQRRDDGAPSALRTDDADHLFTTDEEWRVVGTAVTGLGDLDGDGLDDLAVSVPGDTIEGDVRGSVRVFMGDGLAATPGGELAVTEADHTLTGHIPDEAVGLTVVPAGDLNEDGRVDVLISSRNHAYLVFNQL